MTRSRSALLIIATSGILLGACKKEEAAPQAIPDASVQSATPIAEDSAAKAQALASGSASAAPAAPAVVAPPVASAAAAGSAAASHAGGASIDPCCKALSDIASHS